MTATDTAVLEELVANFARNLVAYTRSGSAYNEAEARSDFINGLFESLGWDVTNRRGLPRPLREVILEASVAVENSTKKPDYEFRHDGVRKFFVEAKKPSVDLLTATEPALQVRRYGWSAGLPVSVLTNFRHLRIYDCTVKPLDGDGPEVALLKSYSFDELVEKFPEIEDMLSLGAVTSGRFEDHFAKLIEQARGDQTFDKYFLKQIEQWRFDLSTDLHKNNPTLAMTEVNRIVQLFLNRIVFLRICEDRNLEEYATLRSLSPSDALPKLLELFRDADQKYDSGLFELLTNEAKFSNDALISVVQDLYYPRSPYSFSVVSLSILGSIYERFIATSVELVDGKVTTIEKPEVRESNGVVPTPEYIVREIVDRAFKLVVTPLITRVLDPAVGSGIFLNQAYSLLLQLHLEECIKTGKTDQLRVDDGGDKFLSLEAKTNILLQQVFGVDIDPLAAEVAKFSLLLKLLEDVPNGEIETRLELGIKALPKLENNIKSGNSLVDSLGYFKFRDIGVHEPGELEQIRPFNWQGEYPKVFTEGGFGVVLGNPPYTRIQTMVHYAPFEAQYYQDSASPYKSSRANNFDKYQLFVERGYSLLKPDGVLGFIVPNKFMTITAGGPLRAMIAQDRSLIDLTHFGALQLFPGATTYTSLLFLQKKQNTEFTFERVSSLRAWRDNDRVLETLPYEHVTAAPWVFPSAAEKKLFAALEVTSKEQLWQVAEIFVGLQTSADDIFIRKPERVNGTVTTFKDKNGKVWDIETAITRPMILDIDDFNPLLPMEPNQIAIFPYKKVDDRNVAMDESELKKTFPLAHAYLSNFRDQLEKRSMQANGSWFRYGRSQSLNKFEESKLIFKNPALKAAVACDSTNIMFTGGGTGPYYGLRSNGKLPELAIHALLNSIVFDRWVKVRSSVFRGGYYTFSKQFVEKFPIFDYVGKSKEVDDLVRSWKGVLDRATGTTGGDQLRELAQMRTRVDEKICALYGIDAAELLTEGGNIDS